MAPAKRVDIEAIAAAYDKQRASLNAKTTIEGARAECLKAIEMLKKAKEGAKLSEQYLKNSTALIVEEVREIRMKFDRAFEEDYHEMERLTKLFKNESTPLVNDIERLHKEIRRFGVNLDALYSTTEKSVENSDDLKELLSRKYSRQEKLNHYHDKLKELEKSSVELSKARFMSQNLVQIRENPSSYYGTAEGSVLIPRAAVSIIKLKKDLDQLCHILGREELGDLGQFRILTSQLNEAVMKQVDLIKDSGNVTVSVAESAETTESSLPVATSEIRVPFIDELSTILYEPSVASLTTDVTSSDSETSFSDFEVQSSASEYLTSVES